MAVWELQVRKGLDAGIGVNIDNDTLAIGTAPGNDLVLTDPTVSRIHVTLGRRGLARPRSFDAAPDGDYRTNGER